jgi:hypothetical protein
MKNLKVAHAFAFDTVALAALTLGTGPAAALNNYTCEAYVTFTDNNGHTGIEPLGTHQVGGQTIEDAASHCHTFAYKSFTTGSNKAWSTPKEVCKSYTGHPDKWGRGFTGNTREVWALDKFQQISNGYNRVSAYTATCDGSGGLSSVLPTGAPVYELVGPPNNPF